MSDNFNIISFETLIDSILIDSVWDWSRYGLAIEEEEEGSVVSNVTYIGNKKLIESILTYNIMQKLFEVAISMDDTPLDNAVWFWDDPCVCFEQMWKIVDKNGVSQTQKLRKVFLMTLKAMSKSFPTIIIKVFKGCDPKNIDNVVINKMCQCKSNDKRYLKEFSKSKGINIDKLVG